MKKYAAQMLWKVMVQPFFQRNAGWLLFLFVALFGVAQNPKQYHIQLMQSILLSPVTLAFVMVAWFLYGLKTLAFVIKCISSPENVFLKELQVLAPDHIFILMMGVQTVLLAPIWIYATITVLAGFYMGFVLSPVLIILFMVILVSGTALLGYRNLMSRGIKRYWQMPSLKIPKRFYSILVWHSFNQGKIKWLGVKLASFTMLFIPLVWNAGHSSLSDFILFFQAAIAAHALVAYDYVQFLEGAFPLLRNMPLSRLRIFLLYPVAYAVLLLPEAAILLYYLPRNGFNVYPLSLIIFAIGQLLFLSAVAYEKNLTTSEFSMVVAVVCGCLLFILPLAAFWLVGCLLAVAGYLIFYNLYYKYEPDYKEEHT